MLNRYLIEFYRSPNNGKQVAELPDDRRLVLVHSSEMGFPKISLWQSRSVTPVRFGDFELVAELVGPHKGLFGYGGSVIVVGDRLHFGWTVPYALGLQYCTAEIQDVSYSWSPVQKVMTGDVQLGDLVSFDGSIVMTWKQTHNKSDDSVGLVWLENKEWQTREVHRGGSMFPPVADVDQQGVLHLVWFTPAEELFHARLSSLSEETVVERIGYGAMPSIICLDDNQLLLACEDEYGYPQSYLFNGSSWSRTNFNRTPWLLSDQWLGSDQCHSPQLTRDRYGVVWMFWCDNTRRSVFWSRWLGYAWSEPYNGPRVYYRKPRFDSNLLPLERLAVQKWSRAKTSDIGMLLITERPGEVVEYRREIVPDLKVSGGRKVLFFDLLELARVKDIELQVEQAVKHPESPLMELGSEGSFDENRVFGHGTVIFEYGRYRMWYEGIFKQRPGERKSWWDLLCCGYAESDDGVHWRRVNVGLVEWKGSKENNIVPYLRGGPVVIKDDAEPDASQRYKAFHFYNSGEHLEMARAGKYDPLEEMFYMDLFVSPDGLHFRRVPGEVHFPGQQAKPFSAIPQSVFRDDDEPDTEKRYKAYGFMSLNLRRRGTCYLTSHDCVHWTAHEEIPVIDPAIRGMPPAMGGNTGQVHDTVVIPYEGYYIALFQDQHDPENMPVELAVGRDAETFRHIKVGSKVIPLGASKQWDSMNIAPTTPVILEKEIRLYYGGLVNVISEGGQEEGRPGLAILRRDGFTALRLAGDAHLGWFETIPFSLPEGLHELRINANCPTGTEIRIALIDGQSGDQIYRYSSDECEPITGNFLDATVRWKAGQTLPKTELLFRLRFELKGTNDTPSLYAFRLVTV